MDYEAYIKKWQKDFVKLSAAQDKELARLYIELAGKIKAKLPDILGDLQLAQQKMLLNGLLKEAAKLTNNFEKLLDKSLLESANLGKEANKFILKGYQEALLDKGYSVKMTTALHGIPKAAVEATFARIWTDGLKLSDRVWRVGQVTRNSIERLVMEAIITGKSASDPILNQALANMFAEGYKGKITTLHGRKVWYEASRILRTERTAAFREADRMASLKNPGVEMVEWRRGSSCLCPTCQDLADKSPYKKEYVPFHPHPNCMCYTVPIAESVEKFTDRWIDFMNKPSSQPDLGIWYKEIFKKAA